MKTNKQLKRLCINHWKRMLELTVGDIKKNKEAPSDNNCAFCSEYISNACEGCPIYNRTGRSLCFNTPYEEAVELYDEIRLGEHKRIKTFHKAVQQEIEFLESLEV